LWLFPDAWSECRSCFTPTGSVRLVRRKWSCSFITRTRNQYIFHELHFHQDISEPQKVATCLIYGTIRQAKYERLTSQMKSRTIFNTLTGHLFPDRISFPSLAIALEIFSTKVSRHCKPGVPSLSLTMKPFSISTDERVPLKFLNTKYFIVT